MSLSNSPFALIFALAVMGSASAPADSQELHFGSDEARALDAAVEAGNYGTVTSVMILAKGTPLHAAWFNGADAATLHDTRSVTKTMTGMVVGAAIADGYLGLDTEVASFFPELMPFAAPDPRKLAITVEDLLTMSGPLECNDWNEFSRGNEERMYLVEDWSAFFWSLPVRGFPSWQPTPEASPYGRAFSYCTAGVQLLGEVVERAVGQPYTEYAETRLFERLGIEGPEWPRNGLGQAHLGGGLRLTTEALASLGELQRLGGVVEGDRLLPQDWTDASIAHQAAIPNTPGWEYGYLWWLMPYEVEGETFWAAGMNGNGGNRVFILPDFDLTVVFTNTDFNTPTMHQNASAFFQTEIVARLALE